MPQDHLKKLENLYYAAPINEALNPTISISENISSIEQFIGQSQCHAGQFAHGSVIFKLLDDAAYFAAASSQTEFFLVTASYEIKFKKPAPVGHYKAIGELIDSSGRLLKAKSKVIDENDQIIAKGKGLFIPTKQQLSHLKGYSS
ncbi:PaaI family thioesterase [Salibacter halophilus]|uniref:PaaI family thioesterase n=1 Tax=Salibacter halophilus TaxID=1803916 RepID=A0A6N6MBC4_9FLAO|nr:PaaI family thioesterase [Salibacter halophilus]KAB1065737.1 PaaI family thioesterase [Salibacter halophilus]